MPALWTAMANSSRVVDELASRLYAMRIAAEIMRSQTAPERLIWAVQRLAIKPADRVLEIGCGRGIAAALVCDRLKTGTIIALDRSPAMIAAARARNRDHIAAGKAVFETSALTKTGLAAARFDKIFAVNVNAFWIDAARELAVIQSALAVRGVLHLVYEPPGADQIKTIAMKLSTTLKANGFAVTDVTAIDRNGVRLLGIAARVASARSRRKPA